MIKTLGYTKKYNKKQYLLKRSRPAPQDLFPVVGVVVVVGGLQAQIMPFIGVWANDCFNIDAYYTRKHASFCDKQSIHEILSRDFTKTGKCNWYEMKHAGLETNPMAMAFPVN